MLATTRTTVTQEPPLEPDTVVIIEIEISPGMDALQRVLTVLRLRGLSFTRLEYQADDHDGSDLVTVYLKAPSGKSSERVSACLQRIVAVLAVRTICGRADVGC